MDFKTNNYSIVLGTSATVTLPDDVVYVKSVTEIAEGETSFSASSLSVVTGAPAAGQVQFAGNPAAPSPTLTLNAAPATAGGLLLVEAVPVGAMPTAS